MENHLDIICANISKAETLNALHACRDGHPLGNEFKFRNAYAVICQLPVIDRMGIPATSLDWLEDKAKGETA